MEALLELDSLGDETTEDAMAGRGVKRASDPALVSAWVGRLKANVADEAAFRRCVASLRAEGGLSLNDVCTIAWTFAVGGTKPKSKAAAFDKIERRYNELMHKKANATQASKARVW